MKHVASLRERNQAFQSITAASRKEYRNILYNTICVVSLIEEKYLIDLIAIDCVTNRGMN